MTTTTTTLRPSLARLRPRPHSGPAETTLSTQPLSDRSSRPSCQRWVGPPPARPTPLPARERNATALPECSGVFGRANGRAGSGSAAVAAATAAGNPPQDRGGRRPGCGHLSHYRLPHRERNCLDLTTIMTTATTSSPQPESRVRTRSSYRHGSRSTKLPLLPIHAIPGTFSCVDNLMLSSLVCSLRTCSHSLGGSFGLRWPVSPDTTPALPTAGHLARALSRVTRTKARKKQKESCVF